MSADFSHSVPLVVSDERELRDLVSTMLSQGAPIRMRATGSSMEPSIPAGALVELVSVRRPPRVGDVVLVLPADGAPLIHRVRRTIDSMVITIGDNRALEDPPVPDSAVVALARGTARSGSFRSLHGGRRGAATAEARRWWRRIRSAVARWWR